MNYRKDIQILRGIAVLLVVFFHLGFKVFSSGFLGVDVFFVVSGFLMSVLYNKNKKFEFYKKRSLRLLPAYFTTVFFTLAVSIILITPNEYRQVFSQTIYAEAFASNIGYWMQNSYFSKAEFNPLLHLWSLGVEIQFYLFIPVLFYFFRINRIFFFIMLIGSLTLCFWVVGISPKTSFFMMPLRLWEFFLGYGVAKYATKNGTVKYQSYTTAGTIGLLILMAIPMFNVKGEAPSFIYGHPGLFALVIALATGGVLAFGIPKAIEKSFAGNILENVGKYSYSIYLVHYPVIVLYLYKPFSGTLLKIDNVNKFLIIVIIISVLSYLMFHIIENKFRKRHKILFYLILFPIITLLFAFFGHFIHNNMYSKNEMLIFNAFSDRDTYRCGKIFRLLHPSNISCKITNFAGPSKMNILFIGDSHADAIKREFAIVANSMKTDIYFLVSNNPLLKNSSITPERIIKEAVEKNSGVLVLHYAPGATDAAKLKKLVDLSKLHGIIVFYIMPVPTFDRHVPEALWKNMKTGEPLPVKTLHDYCNEHDNLYKALSGIKADNFKISQVKQYFCATGCALSDASGKPLYFDGGHLTLTGSRRLSALFRKIIHDGQKEVKRTTLSGPEDGKEPDAFLKGCCQ